MISRNTYIYILQETEEIFTENSNSPSQNLGRQWFHKSRLQEGKYLENRHIIPKLKTPGTHHRVALTHQAPAESRTLPLWLSPTPYPQTEARPPFPAPHFRPDPRARPTSQRTLP